MTCCAEHRLSEFNTRLVAVRKCDVSRGQRSHLTMLSQMYIASRFSSVRSCFGSTWDSFERWSVVPLLRKWDLCAETHTTLDGRDVRQQVDIDHAERVVFHCPIEHFAAHVELGASSEYLR